jgi:transposase
MNKTYYLGLDVHKEKVAIAYAPEGGREEPAYYGKCAASVQNTERTLRKLAKMLGVEFRTLKVCYEAGPTGFVLARRLLHLGLECVVIAPTKTERKPGEKIKTDRRDAGKLAKLFRNGDVTAVRIPPASDEAGRDVCRARTDAVDDLKRCKQQLPSFLLRNGYNYQDGTSWTQKHMNERRATGRGKTRRAGGVLDVAQRSPQGEGRKRAARIKIKILPEAGGEKSPEARPRISANPACGNRSEAQMDYAKPRQTAHPAPPLWRVMLLISPPFTDRELLLPP